MLPYNKFHLSLQMVSKWYLKRCRCYITVHLEPLSNIIIFGISRFQNITYQNWSNYSKYCYINYKRIEH